MNNLIYQETDQLSTKYLYLWIATMYTMYLVLNWEKTIPEYYSTSTYGHSTKNLHVRIRTKDLLQNYYL